FGIGFDIGRLDGHRTIGHDGAIYGFATAVLGLPDDSLGVVVTATLDGVNAVTDHIATAAARLLLDARGGSPTKTIAAVDTTHALPQGRALSLIGHYANARTSYDLREYEGHLFLDPSRGGFRAELRVPSERGTASKDV